MQELRINYPEVRYDLPAGGRRMVQTIDGYDATILSGKIVRYMGQSTSNLPGRLIRSTNKKQYLKIYNFITNSSQLDETQYID